MAEGWVYLVTNEAMPGFVKIGLTRQDDLTTRLKQLDTTSVPLPFECHYAARVPDCDKLERTLHFVFGDQRPRRGREFFRINPDLAKAIIELVAIEDVVLSDAQQPIDQEQRRDIADVRRRREVRTFTSMSVPEGAELTFLKNRDVTCIVNGPRKVSFMGETMSPSRAALRAVNQMGYDWSAVSGMEYWLYDGVPLGQLPERSASAVMLAELDDL